MDGIIKIGIFSGLIVGGSAEYAYFYFVKKQYNFNMYYFALDIIMEKMKNTTVI